MKKATPFSYRNNPIAQLIEGKIMSVDNLLPQDRAAISPETQAAIFEGWNKSADWFRDIKVLTRPFEEAYTRARPSLEKAKHEILSSTPHGKGCIIYRGQSVCYCVTNYPEHYMQVVIWVFNHSYLMGFLDVVHWYDTTKGNDWVNGWFTRDFQIQAKKLLGIESLKDIIASYRGDALFMINFLRYAQVETKFLPAGQMTKFVDCKYRNDTKSNITILNSTWFTNLVKSDAFKVRGHFRLQPCGEGHKDRKLIWINDFQKEGYTAPARKLNTLNSQNIAHSNEVVLQPV